MGQVCIKFITFASKIEDLYYVSLEHAVIVYFS